jgi:Tol biopolymer transport system component
VFEYPGGKDLLIFGSKATTPPDTRMIYRVDPIARKTADLGSVAGSPFAGTWGEPGKTLLLSRQLNGIFNLWEYGLADKSLTQLTSGAGPDYSPMKDPAGKGIFFVNGIGQRCIFPPFAVLTP